MAASNATVAVRVQRQPGSVWLNTDFYQDEVLAVDVPDQHTEHVNVLMSGNKKFYQVGDGYGQVIIRFRLRGDDVTLAKLRTLRDYCRVRTNPELRVYFRWQADSTDYRLTYLPVGQIPDILSAHGENRHSDQLSVTFEIINLEEGYGE